MKSNYLLSIIILCLLVIAIILKPTYKNFTQFAFGLNEKPYVTSLKKTNDYLIFAVFEKQIYKWDEDKEDYVLVIDEKFYGYLLNFHRIN